MLLQGKKALVTGSSRGIGREIVRCFLEQGAEVWGLCSKPSEVRDEFKSLADEKGVSFHEVYVDIADAVMLGETIKTIMSTSGGFDILVNNAGITRDGLSFRMPMDDWTSVLAVNLTGVFVVSQIVAADMIRKRKGSIINMTSIVGLHGQGGQVNYASSKAGLIGFTKSLAKECGGRGVRVNAIAPGFIETEMTQAVNEEARKSWLDSVPLKRVGTVQDVASAALFLASDMSSYITAQVLGVDGGMGA